MDYMVVVLRVFFILRVIFPNVSYFLNSILKVATTHPGN
jgi:hypothetical protein